MLVNFYGGNIDWDHHNWYATLNRSTRRPLAVPQLGRGEGAAICVDDVTNEDNAMHRRTCISAGRRIPNTGCSSPITCSSTSLMTAR